MTGILELNTATLRDRLADGSLTAVEVAQACLARIDAREPEVQAWVWLDRAAVLRDAKALDAHHAAHGPVGPLHGLPVGIKDVIDTAGIPTENGCKLDVGRIPTADATVVTKLKAAGALIFGKTVTTELAFMNPSKTRNPVNPAHTPGGSSAGSAAAVAAGMIPLALGTQTGGSVARPASFCGVVGVKPSFGAIPSEGVLLQSHSLDTVGVFARDLEGAGILSDVLIERANTPALFDHLQTSSEVTPRFGVIQEPAWEKADSEMVAAFSALAEALGANASPLPPAFETVTENRAKINFVEMAHHFRRYTERDPSQLSDAAQTAIRDGEALPATEYLAALEQQRTLAPALAPLFANHDALIGPSALGPAPEGFSTTGDSIYNGLWTMAGVPTITLPLLTAQNGMPMGVQVIGPVGGENKLIQTAAWLWNWAKAHGFGAT